MSNKKKLEECPLPAVIKKGENLSSRRSESPEPPETHEFPCRRIRASSWDDSDDENFNLKNNETNTKEANEDEGKSQDNPDRRQSPARIRRRRRSSSGSSIISENPLDEKVTGQVGDVIEEKAEDVNFENAEVEERVLATEKFLPPVDDCQKKNCANPEILQELSKNINNMFFGRRKNQRAKSGDVEKKKKEKLKSRPESEKILRKGLSSAKSDLRQLESPKEVTMVEEIKNNEFETIIVPKIDERPKSASFLIMEDLEDIDENEIYKDESKKTERTKSAGESSSNSYRWKVSDKSSSCGIEYLTSGASSASKISDIHNWSGRESVVSPKRGFDSERWCHSFNESRTEKSPYSERGQLTSPTDSTEKSVESEYVKKKTKLEIDSNRDNLAEKTPNKTLHFSETNFGLGDSKNVQCWNVEKPEIEEPQDHGDGNFLNLTNEESWQRLKLQVEENERLKNQFYSENKNKPDENPWILNTHDEKSFRSPKKSKWSMVNNATIPVAKPMSSSSDASTQCTILQDKEPSSRKRKRKQLAKNLIIREEVVIERTATSSENEKIVKTIPVAKKKEVKFDYNEITICDKEEINERDNFLMTRKSREKDTTDYKNFLAKNKAVSFNAKSTSLKRKLQLWKNQRASNSGLRTIQETENNLPEQRTGFLKNCECFQVVSRVIRNFFKSGR